MSKKKRIVEDGIRVSAYIGERHVEIAEALGKNNLSAGIRKALDQAAEKCEERCRN